MPTKTPRINRLFQIGQIDHVGGADEELMASLGKFSEVIHCRHLTARHLVQLGMEV
jgi:hypothetical protein